MFMDAVMDQAGRLEQLFLDTRVQYIPLAILETSSTHSFEENGNIRRTAERVSFVHSERVQTV